MQGVKRWANRLFCNSVLRPIRLMGIFILATVSKIVKLPRDKTGNSIMSQSNTFLLLFPSSYGILKENRKGCLTWMKIWLIRRNTVRS